MATLVEEFGSDERERVEALTQFIEDECAARLAAYSAQPRDTNEHYETEIEVLSGGYAYRQLFELVQNAADAVLESEEGSGRIYVRLEADRLIAANTGAPLDQDGVVALLNARSSSKRSGQIGRFGIGFKSLLKLGGTVDLVSRSIGMQFNPEWCRAKIRQHLGLEPEARAPGMRLAQVLDPLADDSPLLGGQPFDWATTVVNAEIRQPKDRERLAEEMAQFPAEFVLFLSSDIDLELEVVGGPKRTISRRHEGETIIVSDGSSETRWRLFERTVPVDDPDARADALHLQARDEVPLSWAAPVSAKEAAAAGTFWAFFPTQTPTLASGILNAPWKLNSDRTNVIPGAYNRLLMEAAAELIADNIAKLATEDDPGAPILALPRKVDRQGEVAAPLVEALWERLVETEVVASAGGDMAVARTLLRHPIEEEELVSAWVELADDVVRAKVVHATCQSGKLRSSRLDALAREATERSEDGREALVKFSLSEWIEFVASDDMERAAKLLGFLETLHKQHRPTAYELRRTKFIPSARDGLIAPSQAVICPPDRAPTGKFAVASEIVDRPGLKRVLVDLFDVPEMDEELWDSVLVDSYTQADTFGGDDNWATFWANFQEAPRERVAAFLRDEDPQRFSFRSKAGSFEPRHDLVLPDGPEGEDLDAEILLDHSYHVGHWDRIPKEWAGMFGPIDADEVNDWEGRGWEQMLPFFKTINDLGRRKMPYGPREYLLGILGKDRIDMPPGWRILPELPAALAAQLTPRLIQGMSGDLMLTRIRSPEGPHPYSSITFGHTTRPDAYPSYEAPHPFVYWLHKFGWVALGEKHVPLSAFGQDEREALKLLGSSLSTTLTPYFDSLDEKTDLPLSWARSAASEDVWGGLFELAWEWTDNFAALTPIWEAAARVGQVPDLVPTRDGPVPLAEVFVTDHPTSGSEVDDGRIVVLAEEAALAWQSAGAQLLADHTELSYEAKLGDPLRLSSLFPELSPILKTRLARRLDALWVRGLKERSGPHLIEPLVAYDHSGLILIERAKFEAEGWNSRTKQLLEFLSAHQLIELTAEEAMAKLMSRRVIEARARVRAGNTLEERLLLAVGGSRKALFSQLTEATREAIPSKLSDQALAALTLAVHGPTILSRLRDVLEAEGLDPPGRWAGEPALTFVLELGFPAEFAASANIRRAAEWIVNGPIHLPPLHDYQDDILGSLEQLFDSGVGRRRAVVSLPTGGGKTRVAAEAIVRLILNGEGKRTVLWVAQTDELCEQAVQCFRQLWVNVGSLEEDLRIVRLWGGQNNPAPPEANEPVVVVASIQTLNARLDVEQLDWLAQPGVVVIDECHHAIAPSYSSLLRWLDVQTGTESEREEEPPVIGLSATPWRGYDDDESRRLAARFDQRWLPTDQHQLHQDLLERKVLAKLTYHPIRYDKVVELSDAEIRHLDQYKELPESFVERIGADPDRNERIIESVLKSPAASILLFANSVKHAQYLAARLHLAGCPAAAVSGETDRLARQHFIRRFKSGELKVLCNHSVLTTGFDAPKADMILISRPVMSPVRYMQMVGRGLRGPKNGGTERCRIITVEDNILNYRDQLAYHFCRRFFEA